MFVRVRKSRLFRFSLCAALLAPLAGCNAFQSMSTNKWFDGNWIETSAGAPVTDMLVYWDNRVRLTEDQANGGVQRPGLAARLYLISSEQFADAQGRIV